MRRGGTNLDIVGVVLVAAVIGSPGGPRAAAETVAPAWSEAREVGPWSDFHYPSMTAGPGGDIHVFWTDRRENRFGIATCELGDGGCATREQVFSGLRFGGHRWVRHAASVDAEGILHLLWRADTDIVHQARAQPGGQAAPWSRAQRVGWGVYPAIAAARAGVLHAAYDQPAGDEREEPCKACSDIHYRRSADGGLTWSHPVNLSGGSGVSIDPGFTLGNGDDVYLHWEEGHDPESGRGEPRGAGVVASWDGGLSWHSRLLLEADETPPQNPVVGVDADGTVVLAYRRGNHVYFRRSADRGRSWSAEAVIEGLVWARGGGSGGIAMAADSARSLHLLATGEVPGPRGAVAILHLEWNGREWSAPALVAPAGGGPGRPRLVVSEGNRLLVMWPERERLDAAGKRRQSVAMWSAARTTAPPVPPVTYTRAAPAHADSRGLRRALEALAALAVVAGVIALARRRGL